MTSGAASNPPLRYRATEPLVSPRALDNVRAVLDEAYLSPGEWVRTFERRWAEICGVRRAVAVSSGTAALHIAMLAAGIGPGDEVIVPALTCPDTLNAARFIGAVPVIVDIERERYGMDPARIDGAVTSRTKAIVPVHLFGCPVRPEVFDVARQRRLLVIEDAAEAHGASSGKRMIGSLGAAGCFSFRGDKMIGVGTGGMITTDDNAIGARAAYLVGLASPGGFDRYASTELGYSYEMSNVHGAIGAAQVDLLDETVEAKRRVAGLYHALLSDADVDKPAPVAGHVWWRYSVLLKHADPRTVHHRLLAQGIETLPPFTPMYRLPMYKHDDLGRFPVAEDVYRRLLSLPAGPRLGKADVEVIAAAFSEALKGC
jgi:perosamine synthetase